MTNTRFFIQFVSHSLNVEPRFVCMHVHIMVQVVREKVN